MLNWAILQGHITSDIYFDTFLIKGKKCPFLRLILFAEGVQGMRVVLWGQAARLYYGYLQAGTELVAIGALENRRYKGKYVYELRAHHLVLVRGYNWERGERIRQRLGVSWPREMGYVFAVGRVHQVVSTGEGMVLDLALKRGSLNVAVPAPLSQVLDTPRRLAVFGRLDYDRRYWLKAEHVIMLDGGRHGSRGD